MGFGRQAVRVPRSSKGEPVLTIVDVDRGKNEREIKLDGISEVVNPAWSPDGNQIAFSALVGGLNDLYIYDLTKGQDDKRADHTIRMPSSIRRGRPTEAAGVQHRSVYHQPRYAQGRRAAAGDDGCRDRRRCASSAGSPMRRTSARSGRLMASRSTSSSDRQGITNIYRTQVDATRRRSSPTSLTGASGITALSPAMSVAGGRLVFSAYENNGYSIYALDTAEQLAGEPRRELPTQRGGAAAATRGAGPVVRGDHECDAGLPAERRSAGAPRPYKPKLGSRFRRSADRRRRRRSVRDVCGRRRVVGLQRHARQPRGLTPARRRPAASTSSAATSSTSIARTAGTGARRSIRPRTSTAVQRRASPTCRAAGLRRAANTASCRPTDRLAGLLVVSVQPRAARGVQPAASGRSRQSRTSPTRMYRLEPGSSLDRGARTSTRRRIRR